MAEKKTKTEKATRNTGPFDWLKWAIAAITDIDRNVALYLLVAFAIIFAAVMMMASGVDQTALQNMAIFIGKAVAAAAVLLFLYSKLRDHYLMAIALHTVVFAGLGYFVAGFVQFMSGSFFNPPLPLAGCFIEPMQRGCMSTAVYSSQDVAEAPKTQLPKEEIDIPLAPSGGFVSGDDPLGGVSAIVEMAPPPETPVYVHFAGAILREDVVAATNILWDSGWNMMDHGVKGQDGGERTGVAQGLNEVRYFRQEDRADAIALAQAYADTVDWVTPDAFSLRDMTAASDGIGPDGLIEIWTSRQ